MEKGYTDITLLLDRSGSMETIRHDIQGGLNTFIEDQKKLDGKCLLTHVNFDNMIERKFTAKPIKEVTDIELVPRGMTALYDALGIIITETVERLSKLKEEEKPEHVIFVVVTDGEENASRELQQSDVKKMISKQTDDYKWHFVYLGANQDAFAVGRGMGFSGNTSMSYSPDAAGVQSSIGATSKNIGMLRTAQVYSMSFSPEDRKNSGDSK